MPCLIRGRGYTDNKESGGCSMGNLVREIRKEVNFSIEEYQQIQKMMAQGDMSNSPFARGKLLK